MTNPEWNRTEDGLPKGGALVNIMDSGGTMHQSRHAVNVWWSPDMVVPYYFEPVSWSYVYDYDKQSSLP
jgi:hypothetical protein